MPAHIASLSRARHRWAVAAALVSLLATLLTFWPATTGPAAASVVPKSECSRYDAGVRRGLCVRDARGGIFWLGTLRGYDGVEIYCIDYAFATDWGVAHRRTLIDGNLPTSTGGTVGAATVAALNYLVTRHPADRVDDDTAAAIGLIIRQVMGDVRRDTAQVMPGGLTVAGPVRDVGFVPVPVIRRARALWDDARQHRGPWRLVVRIDPGPDGKVVVGERVRAVVRAVNGAGRAQATTVALTYRAFSGPASVALGTDGRAVVRLQAPRRAVPGSLSARVGDAPGTAPLVIRPADWQTNPRPGHSSSISQRGLIGRQAATVASADASTVIVKSRPRLVTEASSQRVEVAAEIHDTVQVTGTAGVSGSFFWSLLGPVRPGAGGRCPGQDDPVWADAGVLATGTVATRGDGSYLTPPHQVGAGEVGCLTYVESMPETPATWPTSTAPGVEAETVLVVRPLARPCLSTVTSRQQALVGARLFDRVRVGCLGDQDRIRVRWIAHGPLAPQTGVDGKAGCEGIGVRRWASAPIAARGVVEAPRSRVYATRPFVVRAPGCYTFSESAAATATTAAVSTRPGIAVETSLVTRPPIVEVPEVPTGPAGVVPAEDWAPHSWLADREDRAGEATDWQPRTRVRTRYLERRYQRPRVQRTGAPTGTLRIARLRINAPVEEVPLHHGVMAIPDSPARFGWLGSTAGAGDLVGSSVIAGHTSDGHDRPGPLARLGQVRTGDVIVWSDRRGIRHRFVVAAIARYSRAGGLPGSVFRTDGPHRLRLITCSGRVGGPGGSFHYRDNLVVTARAIS